MILSTLAKSVPFWPAYQHGHLVPQSSSPLLSSRLSPSLSPGKSSQKRMFTWTSKRLPVQRRWIFVNADDDDAADDDDGDDDDDDTVADYDENACDDDLQSCLDGDGCGWMKKKILITKFTKFHIRCWRQWWQSTLRSLNTFTQWRRTIISLGDKKITTAEFEKGKSQG